MLLPSSSLRSRSPHSFSSSYEPHSPSRGRRSFPGILAARNGIDNHWVKQETPPRTSFRIHRQHPAAHCVRTMRSLVAREGTVRTSHGTRSVTKVAERTRTARQQTLIDRWNNGRERSVFFSLFLLSMHTSLLPRALIDRRKRPRERGFLGAKTNSDDARDEIAKPRSKSARTFLRTRVDITTALVTSANNGATTRSSRSNDRGNLAFHTPRESRVDADRLASRCSRDRRCVHRGYNTAL